MMNIAIFGGSFNPPHKAHLNIANEFASLLSLDKLLIIPTFIAPHKQINCYASPEDRINMCRMLFKDEKFTVSDIEIKREGKSYTVDTVAQLRKEYPTARLYLIIGSDMLLSFDRWYRYSDILSECTLCVMTREKEISREELLAYAKNTLGLSKDEIVVSYAGAYEMSSTLIREKTACGEDTSDFLTEDVRKYIEEKRLYL